MPILLVQVSNIPPFSLLEATSAFGTILKEKLVVTAGEYQLTRFMSHIKKRKNKTVNMLTSMFVYT